jgi:hypothetical protein
MLTRSSTITIIGFARSLPAVMLILSLVNSRTCVGIKSRLRKGSVEQTTSNEEFVKAARALRKCIGHRLHCAKTKTGVKCDCGASREQSTAIAEFDHALAQLGHSTMRV